MAAGKTTIGRHLARELGLPFVDTDELIVARLRRSRTVRPLVGDDPTVERVRELLELREPWYREADLAVRSAHTSKLAYARSIARAIREAGVASVARATSKRAL
ncbi:MAG: hypothetical protein PVSMB8_13580 [Vulcanimicrobiaceae bacterium]